MNEIIISYNSATMATDITSVRGNVSVPDCVLKQNKRVVKALDELIDKAYRWEKGNSVVEPSSATHAMVANIATLMEAKKRAS